MCQLNPSPRWDASFQLRFHRADGVAWVRVQGFPDFEACHPTTKSLIAEANRVFVELGTEQIMWNYDIFVEPSFSTRPGQKPWQ